MEGASDATKTNWENCGLTTTKSDIIFFDTISVPFSQSLERAKRKNSVYGGVFDPNFSFHVRDGVRENRALDTVD